MSKVEREEQLARNAALRGEVDSLLETYEQQRHELAAAQAELATATVTAWSSDNLVRVTSNAAGVPLEVHLEAEAFKRSTPDKLGRSITEAVQSAASQANEMSMRAVAPVQELADGIPDLPELIPGAPSIREMVRSLFPEPPTSEPEPMDSEAEDEFYRNRSYLDGPR